MSMATVELSVSSREVQLDSIEWLQNWYRSQCNGEWEHQFGVSIETLDNPGWLVKVDLTGTPLQDLSMEAFTSGHINRLGTDGDHDWLKCKVEANRFEGAGGPLSLIHICSVFKSWVESQKKWFSMAGVRIDDGRSPTRRLNAMKSSAVVWLLKWIPAMKKRYIALLAILEIPARAERLFRNKAERHSKMISNTNGI